MTRPCPDAAALRLAFTRTERRTLRKSDGTAVIEGRRFEVPNRYRHLSLLEVRFAAWDLTQVHLVDPHTGTVLCRLFPQDKAANASGLRRGLQPIVTEPPNHRPITARSTATAGARHRTAAGANARPAGRHRIAARLPPQGRRRRRVNNKMLALYGLKWNPFTPNVPTEALHVTPRLELFCWRVQQLAGDGGFALVTGAPGCGKSATLRILSASLATQRDVTVGVISRPQANIADFYREMGELFGVELRPHNRFAGAKILRQRWQAHIQGTLSRPVLVVDEAQEMQSAVLAELRLLASADLDSHILLTVVLAGDGRLAERLRSDEFLPLASRVRVRLAIERATPQDLQDCLAPRPAAGRRAHPDDPGSHRGHLRSCPGQSARADDHGGRTARGRRPARGPSDRRDAVLRDLRRARRQRDQGGDPPPAMTQLPVQPAWRLAEAPEQQRWLVEGLWSEEAVGIIGGEPKCCKSFLALDLAVAVAAGNPLPAPLRGQRGPAASCSIPPKTRCISSAAASRASVPPPASALAELDVQVITAPSLRLDLEADRARLEETVATAQAAAADPRSVRAPASHR